LIFSCRPWADAAQAWVERAVDVDRPLADRVLARAEELTRTVQAEGLLRYSNVLLSALRERMRQLADAVRVAVSRLSPATIRDAENALRSLRSHRLAGRLRPRTGGQPGRLAPGLVYHVAGPGRGARHGAAGPRCHGVRVAFVTLGR
jgi:hypothetical protein